MNTINHKIKKTALAQVIAVVAAIFIAYISFLGLVYLSHGQIVASAVAATPIARPSPSRIQPLPQKPASMLLASAEAAPKALTA